jgi:hypothetical protein
MQEILKTTIPTLRIFLPYRNVNTEKLGFGFEYPCMRVFFFPLWICGRTNAFCTLTPSFFVIPEPSATRWYQDVATDQQVFCFHRRHLYPMLSLTSWERKKFKLPLFDLSRRSPVSFVGMSFQLFLVLVLQIGPYWSKAMKAAITCILWSKSARMLRERFISHRSLPCQKLMSRYDPSYRSCQRHRYVVHPNPIRSSQEEEPTDWSKEVSQLRLSDLPDVYVRTHSWQLYIHLAASCGVSTCLCVVDILLPCVRYTTCVRASIMRV